MKTRYVVLILHGCLCLALSACGDDKKQRSDNTTPSNHTIGGVLSGLNGTVVLQNNGEDNLTLSENGSFAFATTLNNGGTYLVTILTQPVGQTCGVSNGLGTVNGANISTIRVECVNHNNTVSGIVSGLEGVVVLQNNHADDIAITNNGGFTFSEGIAAGFDYLVTVLSNPIGQTCTVNNGSGRVMGADITDVQINCANNFHRWTRWETSLTSGIQYTNPYADVTVEVTYTGPNGETYTGNAFWDGGNIFRLRFMFPEPGAWTWRTTCSDVNNAGLHNRTGTLTVSPYTGDNVLYARGYPKVSANRRYLTYGDGTPFLWLGDTAWSALMSASQAEWESYIQQRKAQKFNVIQVHSRDGWVNLSEDRNGNTPFTGSGATLAWNPAYWQGVESKVQYANDQGLLVYFTAVRQPGPGFPDTDAVEVARFARNLVARMGGNFVIFSPIADDVWTNLADASGSELAASTSMHLITAHPRFLLSPAETFHTKGYTDFTGLQSGNGWTYDPYDGEPHRPFEAPLASQQAIDWTLALYNRMPTKPIINMEVVYDGKKLQDGDTEDYLQPYPVRLPRSTAYLAMLSGAAGLTYGTGGVWNWGRPVNNASAGWSLSEALAQPSATQMRYLFDLFSELEWWNLVPSHELIQNQPGDALQRMVVSRTLDRTLGVAYLPDNASIELDMSAFSRPMMARWFNPVTNLSVTEVSQIANAGVHTFTKPLGWGDAVLVLQ